MLATDVDAVRAGRVRRLDAAADHREGATAPSGTDESCVFGKLYAATHVRSDRWYKLGRTLLYGRLEDEKPFHSVRRLVQYEDYILRLFSDAGLPVPHPLGIVEITPEREYLLVTEFIAGAKEVGEAEIDDSIIDQGLAVVRRMWEIGMAHRDIKPANLLVRDGTLFLIDSAFAEVRPSPWRQAVDLANMMLVLALRTDAERVYQRARRQFSDEEIAEAFAATRGLTMPSQLRRMLRQQGRDLHGDFLRLLPYRLPPVRIQRWTWRRVGLTLTTLLVSCAVAVADRRQPAGVPAVTARRRRGAPGRRARRPCCSPAASRSASLGSDLVACSEGDDGTPANGVVLMAQSVPTAILGAVPGGHAAGLALRRHGRAAAARRRFWLDSDRDGDRTPSRCGSTESCDTAGATEIPSDRPDMRRLERVDQVTPLYVGRRYYVFDGGCITVLFTLSGEDRSEPLAVATQGLGAVPRDDLRELRPRGERRPAGARPVTAVEPRADRTPSAPPSRSGAGCSAPCCRWRWWPRCSSGSCRSSPASPTSGPRSAAMSWVEVTVLLLAARLEPGDLPVRHGRDDARHDASGRRRSRPRRRPRCRTPWSAGRPSRSGSPTP